MDKKIGTLNLNVVGNSQYVSVSRPTYDKEYQLCKQFLRL